MKPQRTFDKLREFCLSLPETKEVEAWGHPTFRAGEKIFASFGEHEERPCVGVKSTLAEQRVLVTDPRFYVPKYVGRHGWVGFWIDTDIKWGMIEELVLESYRHVAAKRMIKALDRQLG